MTNDARSSYKTEKRILWVSTLTLDIHLHKSAQLEIMKYLSKRGVKSLLVAMRSRNYTSDKMEGVTIFSIPLRYLTIFSSAIFAIIMFLLLPFFLLIMKPNYVITQPEVPFVSLMPGLLVSRFTKAKFLLDIRTTPVETEGFQGFRRKFLFNTSVFAARTFFNGVTILTSLMKNELCNNFKIDPKKVGVWTSGVSATLFHNSNYITESSNLRKKFCLNGKFIVFYHGIFSANRGLKETIRSVKLLRINYPELILFLLGTGPVVVELRSIIKVEGLQNNVIIHDPVDHKNIPKFIGMSDVCIVPLPDNPFWRYQCPIKLLEYLAMEKCVILTDIPAHRMIIGTEKCAIFISSAEPSVIAASIGFAYHNSGKLDKWGKTGRELITKRYIWEKVAEDLENYLQIID